MPRASNWTQTRRGSDAVGAPGAAYAVVRPLPNCYDQGAASQAPGTLADRSPNFTAYPQRSPPEAVPKTTCADDPEAPEGRATPWGRPWPTEGEMPIPSGRLRPVWGWSILPTKAQCNQRLSLDAHPTWRRQPGASGYHWDG